jgi:enoyl-CoA hydratase
MPSTSSHEAHVHYVVEDGIAVLTLDRPPVNALSAEVYEALGRLADRLAADESVRVAILTAAGRRTFSAGADVKELGSQTPDERAAFYRTSSETRRKVSAIPIPIIAAINGPAAGAGVAYATFCDYRISADDAFFTMPEIDRGSVAAGGLTLMAIGVPAGPLRLMLYSGRRVTASEALAMHLVDEVVPYDDLMVVARDRASWIAAKPRHALVAMKQAIREMSHNPIWDEAAYAATQQMTIDQMERPETREGYRAFLEGRRSTD